MPVENRVEILTAERQPKLGTRYSRVTIGFQMCLRVTECIPDRALSRSTTVDGDTTGSTASHGWVPDAD